MELGLGRSGAQSTHLGVPDPAWIFDIRRDSISVTQASSRTFEVGCLPHPAPARSALSLTP